MQFFLQQGIVRSAIGLMKAGCCDYADVEKFREDALFQHLVAEAIPSQESFRQRLELPGGKSWTSVVDAINSDARGRLSECGGHIE